jgi:hypothetical protein
MDMPASNRYIGSSGSPPPVCSDSRGVVTPAIDQPTDNSGLLPLEEFMYDIGVVIVAFLLGVLAGAEVTALVCRRREAEREAIRRSAACYCQAKAPPVG